MIREYSAVWYYGEAHTNIHNTQPRCEDLQDAFDGRAPLTRRVRKTRQDAFAHNKMPRPTRRIQ